MPNNSNAVFEIINNENGKNHKYNIKQLGQKSDELILVSPFLSKDNENDRWPWKISTDGALKNVVIIS